MQQTTVTEKTTQPSAAVGTLAIVGFLALILIGIILAIYAARYIPIAFQGLTGSSSGNQNSLTAVPSTSLSFATSTATAVVATTTYSVPAPTQPVQQPVNTYHPPTQYRTYATTYYVPGSTPVQVPAQNYGLPNLTVRITDIGYYDRDGRFVSDSSMSSDDELVVKILVTNNGTSSTGSWNIRTVIPTATDRTFEFDQDEPSLTAGATLPLTLDLTRGRLAVGNNQEVKVTVDVNRDVDESDESDNFDIRDFDVRR